MHLLISVFVVLVKRDCAAVAHPRSRQEGPARDAGRPRARRSGARGRSLLTHGGGRVIRHGGHFLIAFVGLVDMAVALSAAFAGPPASGFRLGGPSSANRYALWTMRSRMASAKVGSPNIAECPSC